MATDQEKQLIKEQFKRLDINNDGTISKDELRPLLKALDPKINEKDITIIFEQADADKSGSIDYEEFVVWVFGGKASALSNTRRGSTETKVVESAMKEIKEPPKTRRASVIDGDEYADRDQYTHFATLEPEANGGFAKKGALDSSLLPELRRRAALALAIEARAGQLPSILEKIQKKGTPASNPPTRAKRASQLSANVDLGAVANVLAETRLHELEVELGKLPADSDKRADIEEQIENLEHIQSSVTMLNAQKQIDPNFWEDNRLHVDIASFVIEEADRQLKPLQKRYDRLPEGMTKKDDLGKEIEKLEGPMQAAQVVVARAESTGKK